MLSFCALLLAGQPVYRHVLTITGEDEKQVFDTHDRIYSLHVDEGAGEIYVFHGNKNLVRVFDTSGLLVHKFSLNARGDYEGFLSFTVDEEGSIYAVAERIHRNRAFGTPVRGSVNVASRVIGDDGGRWTASAT